MESADAAPDLVKAPVAAKPIPAAKGGKGEQARKVDAFQVGEVLTGKVTRVDAGCAYVSVRDHYGVVPKGQVSDQWVDDVRDFVKRGERVEVRVIKVDRARDALTLSMRQCG